MSKRDDPQLRVRIPEDLKSQLEEKARENSRTLTAEIVDRLKATNAQDYYFSANPLGYRSVLLEYQKLLNAYAEAQSKASRLTPMANFEKNRDEIYGAILTLKKFFDGNAEE